MSKGLRKNNLVYFLLPATIICPILLLILAGVLAPWDTTPRSERAVSP